MSLSSHLQERASTTMALESGIGEMNLLPELSKCCWRKCPLHGEDSLTKESVGQDIPLPWDVSGLQVFVVGCSKLPKIHCQWA